jgi:hypothetical protein
MAENSSEPSIKTHEVRSLTGSETPRVAPSALSNENLSTVLEVSRRQGSRDLVSTEEAITETVPCVTMLLCVVLQIAPKVVRERVLDIYLCPREHGRQRSPRTTAWKRKRINLFV